MAAFTLADALSITPIADPIWNDDGTRIGYLRTVDGETRFAVQSVGDVETTGVGLDDGTYEPAAETTATDVTDAAWRPGTADEAMIVSDGDLLLVDTATGSTSPFVQSNQTNSVPVWHPSGDSVAYLRDGSVWIHAVDGGVRSVDDVAVPDIFAFGTPLEWDPSGRYLATLAAPGETLGVAVLDAETDDVVWQAVPGPDDDCLRGALCWVGEGHLVYAEDSADGTERIYRSVRIGENDGLGVDILSESVDGLLLPHDPVGHESGRLAVVSARTGYRHVYLVDVDDRRGAVSKSRPGFVGEGVVQVTAGEFEARGDAMDTPSFSPDGSRLAYVTNEADIGQRHVEIATTVDGRVTERTRFDGIGGNAAGTAWSPAGDRILFLRGGQQSPVDVHVANATAEAVRRVTASHPEPTRFEGLPTPERVTFDTPDGTEISGYLYLPPDIDDRGEVPSVVYCHGGPISQMRDGFSARPGHVHAFDLVLASSGYAVMELNFRSGIGRGREFEQAIHRNVGTVEVEDCEAAASYLRERPETTDRVGLWGISYGGFLANALATMSNAYDCTVNVAGIWDWRTWCDWAIDHGVTHWGVGEETWFYNRFGGAPDSDDSVVQERYRVGSPNSFVDELETPLLALHGMDDRNVPIEETNDLLQQAVEAGTSDYVEVMYYPEEQHGF
ncbi:prolyl oligopeptidase family serine peptidase, partial [Halogeometricum sp. CBA1124]|uniref:S9 family peptidase n=1 Tax=Halogeometricum sp. CBA1124 TaxID=2668071 RepID=UPI0014297A66